MIYIFISIPCLSLVFEIHISVIYLLVNKIDMFESEFSNSNIFLS